MKKSKVLRDSKLEEVQNGFLVYIKDYSKKFIFTKIEYALDFITFYIKGEFVECLDCAKKPGSPTLCHRCLIGRENFEKLTPSDFN
jgi:hypothetical protein